MAKEFYDEIFRKKREEQESSKEVAQVTQTSQTKDLLEEFHEEVVAIMQTSSDKARERRNPNRSKQKMQGLKKKDLKRLGIIRGNNPYKKK